MELDHVFVVCRPPPSRTCLTKCSAALADRAAIALRDAGFAEGEPRSHPGQGTANRRFVVEGFMFELLYVEDATALNSASTARFGLRERFCAEHSSPFGIAWRPSAVKEPPDFDCDVVKPPYLPPELHVNVASVCDAQQPLLFHLPFATGYAALPGADVTQLRALSFACPNAPVKGAWAELETQGLLNEAGSDDQAGGGRMSLEFATQTGEAPRVVDLPAELPVDITLWGRTTPSY